MLVTAEYPKVGMANELLGRKVAILLAPKGTEQVEFTEPKNAVEDASAEVDVIGVETGEVQTMNHDVEPGDTFTVEKAFSEISADDYDALSYPAAAWARTNSAATGRR